MALERKEISKTEKLSKIRLVGMHGGKGAVGGLGGIPTSEQTVSFKKEKTEKMDAEETMGRRPCQILQSLQKSSTHDKSKKEALRKKIRQTNKTWRL